MASTDKLRGTIQPTLYGYCLECRDRRQYKINIQTAQRLQLTQADIGRYVFGTVMDVPPPDGYCGFVDIVTIGRMAEVVR